MIVFDWVMTHLDLVILALTVLLNLALLASWVLRIWRGDRATALQKWLKMLEAAREFEMEAEGFSHYSAAEKLNYVLSRLRTLAVQLEIPFEEGRLVEAVSRQEIDTSKLFCHSVESH